MCANGKIEKVLAPSGAGTLSRAKRKLPDRDFAGSITPLGVMLKNVTGIGVPLVDAVKMASITPAKVIGVDKLYGSVAEGKKADIYIADEELNPQMTIVNGKIVNKEE